MSLSVSNVAAGWIDSVSWAPVFAMVNECSFRDNPFLSARARIAVLKCLLPVKYKTANGYCSGVVNKKSMRRWYLDDGTCPIIRHFVFPCAKMCLICPDAVNLAMMFLKRSSWLLCEFVDVKMTSISPDVSAPRR